MLYKYEDGIYAADAEYEGEGKAAVYILREGERAAIVETAHNASFGRVAEAMDEIGIKRENADFIFLTHVHLDHAGGAGLYAKELPNAKVVVHPRGAKHMIAPDRLIAGVEEVYGKSETERMYGKILPVPAERVIAPEDGEAIDFAGRAIRCLYTPGHAKHHMSFWDEKSRSIFSGDAFGISYPEMKGKNGKWLIPTTSPVQFDPEEMVRSIDKMCGLSPERVCLTHFGELTNVKEAEAQLKKLLTETVREAKKTERSEEALTELIKRRFLECADEEGYIGTEEELIERLSADIRLNAQGTLLLLNKLDKR
jgi:glyoxylase-like metal-dependent hydrolase (beta-lactamase superfamily II)